MKKDNFGDRIKTYEQEYETILKKDLPIIVRIDGKCFSTLTKNCKRPFDEELHCAMVEVTKALLKEFGFNVGYTQSDEITLIYFKENPITEVPFAGRLQKFISVTSSIATKVFNSQNVSSLQGKLASFDSRVFQVPDLMEASNVLLWRTLDCEKNAISMASRAYFSHKDLLHLNGEEMLIKLKDFGIDYDNFFPSQFRLGSFVLSEEVEFLRDDNSTFKRNILASESFSFKKLSLDKRIEFVYNRGK